MFGRGEFEYFLGGGQGHLEEDMARGGWLDFLGRFFEAMISHPPGRPNGLEHKLFGVVAWLDSKIEWLQISFLDYPPVNFKMAMEIHPFYK